MSSGSDSDEEYVPGEPEQLSEEGSADEATDLQYEKELEVKNQKRTLNQSPKGRKKQKKNGHKEIVQTEEKKELQEAVPENEKQKEEDLWAKFLEGTDTKPKAAPKEMVTNTDCVVAVAEDNANKNKTETKAVIADADKDREKRIFEFAGETIVVENNVIKEKIKTADSPATGSKSNITPRRSGGGLSGLLNNLNKTNKLSTLEKSKLDWVTFKKEEGIEEEIDSHNKGKDGYLDRQDFLERADMRQYEIERDLRMSRRSNR